MILISPSLKPKHELLLELCVSPEAAYSAKGAEICEEIRHEMHCLGLICVFGIKLSVREQSTVVH